MTERGRDGLILLLAGAGAGLDAWSYFGLGHVFVANMTGNTVLLGFASVTGGWARAGMAALSLGCYIGGAFAGALLAKPVRRVVEKDQKKQEELARPGGPGPGHAGMATWPAQLVWLHAAELVLITGAALAATVWRPAEASAWARALIGVVAFSVGIQSAAMNAMRLPGIVTTYITGTWTTLATGMALLVDGEETGARRGPWERRLLLQGATLAIYCGSACVAGLLYRAAGASWMGWWPALLLLLAVAGGCLLRRRSTIGS